MEPKKPTGGAAMDELARKLMQVPKPELARQVRKWKSRKRKPKK